MLRRRQAGATPAQPLAVARDATDSRGEEPALRLELEALRARQEHLEAARADYEDLFDFAPATYALLNAAGIIVKISLAACRLLDVERRHLVGHALLSFVVKQDRRELLEHLRRCRSQLTAVESELRFSRPDGTLVTCRLYSKGGFYVGRAVFPTIIIDQTDRLALDDARLSAERSKAAAERAQAASSAKDQFLATISHELRTPLTPALIAATGLAASSALPETSRQMAATIKRNIELEAHLIDDLLDVARISRDRVDLNLETIDLHEVLGEALATCAPAAAAKPVIIEASLDATEHHVRGDSLRLHQVFWNLLNNAVKFTEGGGTIVVRSENVWDTVVRISIRDNGAGMDSSLIDTLFSPFERRPAQRGGSRSGLGLGLAICKGIVGAHGGQIRAASEGPDRGATFAVELTTAPAPQRSAADPPTLHPASANPFPATAARRVLLIEDDADSREMLWLFLSHQGYTVEVAPSLHAGLGRLTEGWDVVISDIGLPDGSGLDVARHARQLSNRPCRLIALTGYGATADIDASREAGFDDHLVKPFDLDQLLVAMGSAADLRSG